MEDRWCDRCEVERCSCGVDVGLGHGDFEVIPGWSLRDGSGLSLAVILTEERWRILRDKTRRRHEAR